MTGNFEKNRDRNKGKNREFPFPNRDQTKKREKMCTS